MVSVAHLIIVVMIMCGLISERVSSGEWVFTPNLYKRAVKELTKVYQVTGFL